jgi:hypothetical protein
MNAWNLWWTLRRLRQRASPSQAFSARLEATLAAKGYLPTSKAMQWSHGFRLAGAVLSSVFLMVSGTGVYAYSSDQVLPEHPLYPVRLMVERVELAMASSGEAAERVRLKHAERRTHELAVAQIRHGKLSNVYPEMVLESLEPVLLAKGKEMDSASGQGEYFREVVNSDRDMLSEIVDEREVMEAESDAPSAVLDEEVRSQVEQVSRHLKDWQEAR